MEEAPIRPITISPIETPNSHKVYKQKLPLDQVFPSSVLSTIGSVSHWAQRFVLLGDVDLSGRRSEVPFGVLTRASAAPFCSLSLTAESVFTGVDLAGEVVAGLGWLRRYIPVLAVHSSLCGYDGLVKP